MNSDQAHATIVDAITTIAPDTDPSALPADADLLEELELDSIDLVGIVTKIQERTGVEIPESDYRELATMSTFVAYLAGRSAGES